MINHSLIDIKLLLYKPMVAKLLCCGMGFLLLLQLVLGLVNLVTLDSTIKASLNHKVATTVVRKPANLQTVLQVAFFGDYVPKQINDSEIKQSMLDLKVVGILFAKREENATVLIQIANGEEKSYRLGDVLPGGAIIKKITPTLVLVLRKGVLERLSLPKNKVQFETPPKPLPMRREEK